jgi:transposase InsO family protein
MERSSTVFLKRAVAWFAAQGVQVRRVMTDNGARCISRAFAATRSELGPRHLRTRPCKRQTNGKAARFSQTLLREWACARDDSSSVQRHRQLPH